MSQNTDFSLLWSQHMVSYINLHHKSASKYFHKNSSSEYCIHVDLTIVTILLKNVGVISNCKFKGIDESNKHQAKYDLQ